MLPNAIRRTFPGCICSTFIPRGTFVASGPGTGNDPKTKHNQEREKNWGGGTPLLITRRGGDWLKTLQYEAEYLPSNKVYCLF